MSSVSSVEGWEGKVADASRTELRVDGMTCSNCARHVTEALRSVPGVASAGVELDRGRAIVRWRPDAAPKAADLISAVESAGYEAKELSSAETGAAPERVWSPLEGWRFNAVVGTICTLPLLIGEWFFGLGIERGFHWFAFAMALPVQVFCGAKFYRGAWNQLKTGSSNMDTLVSLGSTAAFLYSAWALFAGLPGHLYFMEAAAIITLVSVGHWLESRMSAKAAGSLRALLNLAPQTARRIKPDGAEEIVSVVQLRGDDKIVLKPGDRVPTDGEITEGQSAVDESMLTGESLPIDKKIADKLYAGTINVNGQLLMRVTAVGDSTALAHIIESVQRAQTSRASIQRLGDRVSSVFVPIVIVIALLTAAFWGFAPDHAGALHHWLAQFLWPSHPPLEALAAAVVGAAAVLIVACPCAMGLATPVAIMAGTNSAAQRGILIRDGVALEKAGQITAVMFDKTGTLTQGKPAVVASEIFSAVSSDKTEMHLAAALARRSTHPLSQAVAKLDPDEYDFARWNELRGAGVEAEFNSEIVRLGSLRWLTELRIDLSAGNAFVEKWTGQGGTILGLSRGAKLIALLALVDTIKTGAAEVVQELARQKLSVYLITGDNPRTAKSIADQVGIPSENVFAEVGPERKSELVKQLQQGGARVAFVGDGINDAPALEQADLGIAVSKASDVASEAADIILLKSDIHAIPEALGLARATLRTIKQNLFWAFFYNAAGIPLAALGFLSPVLCAAAMGFSDLIVIGNALRLRRWKLKN